MFVDMPDTMCRMIHRPAEIAEQRIKVLSENDISNVFILHVLSYSKRPRPDIPNVTLPELLGNTERARAHLPASCQVSGQPQGRHHPEQKARCAPHTQKNSELLAAEGPHSVSESRSQYEVPTTYSNSNV
nr:hypothetical protein [Tanacetum cinerariifolium]